MVSGASPMEVELPAAAAAALRRSSRASVPPSSFSPAAWSAYDRGRLGSRHESVHDESVDEEQHVHEQHVPEALAAEPMLAAELGALFTKLRAMLADPDASTGGGAADATDELDGEIERAAVVTMHGALLRPPPSSRCGVSRCHARRTRRRSCGSSRACTRGRRR
jgi:hypothetical protein